MIDAKKQARLDAALAAMNAAKYAYEEASSVWVKAYNDAADTVGCIMRSADAAEESRRRIKELWERIYLAAACEWAALPETASRWSRVEDMAGVNLNRDSLLAVKVRKKDSERWSRNTADEKRHHCARLREELASVERAERDRDKW